MSRKRTLKGFLDELPQWAFVVATIVLVIIMAVIAWSVPPREEDSSGFSLVAAWLLNLMFMFGIMGTIGLSIKSNWGWWAIFVDNRRMVSLSRFQIVLWTLVVLSALWTIGIARVADSRLNPEAYGLPAVQAEPEEVEEEAPQAVEEEEAEPRAGPLDLQLPQVLWALMGISVTSAVASPLIKENKQQRSQPEQAGHEETYGDTIADLPFSDERKEEIKDKYAVKGSEVVKKGQPEFSDMFRGETVKDFPHVDIAKVQNFFFTVVAVIGYATALGAAMGRPVSSLFQFPDVTGGLLAILGISHGGYLVSKAANTPAPSTATTPPEVESITPDSAPESQGSVQVTIEGKNFREDKTHKPQVLLTGVGPDIMGSGVTVVAGTRISCAFSISSAATGARRLLVVNPDGTQGYKDSALTIT